ncbi:hypothetical protein [Cryptosporangium phraense]|uniref:Uncharacterized protein n=1 Tax=Cryptosporangium phraense TaxID=2593070 RepID=A0A545APE2_9ACTN|nr:hypothetical protein [Cryptosporangium phraense]TQS43160.1 hypothetical protein FL583_20130 [Cryptosporangium phraense]
MTTDPPELTLTAGDVVAMVAQQMEVSGARPTLTDESKLAAERVAEQLLDTLSGDLARPANGAQHPPPPPPPPAPAPPAPAPPAQE